MTNRRRMVEIRYASPCVMDRAPYRDCRRRPNHRARQSVPPSALKNIGSHGGDGRHDLKEGADLTPHAGPEFTIAGESHRNCRSRDDQQIAPENHADEPPGNAPLPGQGEVDTAE